MRKSKQTSFQRDFSILTLDDDPIMTSTLQAFFQRSGYRVDVEHEPYTAIERIRTGHYDILLLDFLMTPICGDQVVSEIRQFNRDIFIILLTGHRSVAPPVKTIRELDIQGYYEKSDRFDQLELLVESCVKSILQMRTIRTYQDGLSAIMDSLPEIYHLQSLDHIMDSILHTATSFMGAKTGVLELNVTQKSHRDPGIDVPTSLTQAIGNPTAPPSLKGMLSKDAFSHGSILFQDGWSMAAIWDNDGRMAGLLSVSMPHPPQADQVQLLEVFSKQVTAALNNVRLHSIVSDKNDELTQAYARLRDSYMEIIDALRLLVDARDIYTRGHSDRVSERAVQIAKAMGKDETYCESIRIAGLFHDIGKIGVSDDILLKNTQLTDAEFEVMKSHPEDGARILSAISMFRDIAPIVRSHHEHFNGNGYPKGLSGVSIPEEARIIAVADAFDAMTSDRSYRKALSLDATVAQLELGRGTQFDPHIVDTFLSILNAETGALPKQTQSASML